MCAFFKGSRLRESSIEAVKSFSWSDIAAELERHAPTLFNVLKGCVGVKPRKRLSSKRSKRPNQLIILCVCGAILLRNKNANMNLLQRVVSLILNAGHVSKQVQQFSLHVVLCICIDS